MNAMNQRNKRESPSKQNRHTGTKDFGSPKKKKKLKAQKEQKIQKFYERQKI